MGSIQHVELKSERFTMAYRLLLAYAFVLPGSSKIAHTRIRNIGPTTISFRNNDQLLPLRDRGCHQAKRCRVEDIPRHRPGEAAEGKVIAIGPGGPRRKQIDGVEYLIMKESDIKESDIMEVLVEVEAKKKAA